MSVLIAAHERRAAHEATQSAEPQMNSQDLPRIVRITTPRVSAPTIQPILQPTTRVAETPARVQRSSMTGSVIRYLATLLRALVKVALGIVAVIVLVAIYEHLEKTNRAVLLTVLVMSVFYLTARVARSRQKRS